MSLGTVILLLVALVGILAALLWIRHLVLRRACEKALRDVYSGLPHLPRLILSYSYGYPALALLFRNSHQMQQAASSGLNELFIQRIGVICEGRGSKARPFDAKLAVGFDHENILTRSDVGLG